MRILATRSIRTNAIILFAGNGTGAVLSFLLSVLIGRYLGADGLGSYAAVLAWVYPLSMLAEGGVGTWIIRHIARQPEQVHGTVRSAAWLRLLTALPLCLLLWILAPLLGTTPDVQQGLRLSAPLIFIIPMTGIFNSVFRAGQWMLPAALLNVGMLLAQVILLVFVLYAGGDVRDALTINILTSAGQCVAAWLIYRRWFPITEFTESVRIPIGEMLRGALPFAIAGVLAAIQMRVNFLLLEQFAGTVAVGLYAAAMRYIEAGRLFPQAYMEALFPTLNTLANDAKRMKQLFQRATRRLLLYGLAITGLLIVAAKPLITTPYGDEFAAAIPLLGLLALSMPLLTLKGVRTLYWYTLHEERFSNTVTIVAICVQVVVAWLLISYSGVIGAGLAVIAAECTSVALLWMRR